MKSLDFLGCSLLVNTSVVDRLVSHEQRHPVNVYDAPPIQGYCACQTWYCSLLVRGISRLLNNVALFAGTQRNIPLERRRAVGQRFENKSRY